MTKLFSPKLAIQCSFCMFMHSLQTELLRCVCFNAADIWDNYCSGEVFILVNNTLPSAVDSRSCFPCVFEIPVAKDTHWIHFQVSSVIRIQLMFMLHEDHRVLENMCVTSIWTLQKLLWSHYGNIIQLDAEAVFFSFSISFAENQLHSCACYAVAATCSMMRIYMTFLLFVPQYQHDLWMCCICTVQFPYLV